MILSTDGQLPLAERIANLREYMKRTSLDISLWGGCNASELLDALAASEAGAAALRLAIMDAFNSGDTTGQFMAPLTVPAEQVHHVVAVAHSVAPGTALLARVEAMERFVRAYDEHFAAVVCAAFDRKPRPDAQVKLNDARAALNAGAEEGG